MSISRDVSTMMDERRPKVRRGLEEELQNTVQGLDDLLNQGYDLQSDTQALRRRVQRIQKMHPGANGLADLPDSTLPIA